MRGHGLGDRRDGSACSSNLSGPPTFAHISVPVFCSRCTDSAQLSKGVKVVLLGLAFKPDTDDACEAPPLKIAPALIEADAEVAHSTR